jgi:hypothetical protein
LLLAEYLELVLEAEVENVPESVAERQAWVACEERTLGWSVHTLVSASEGRSKDQMQA